MVPFFFVKIFSKPIYLGIRNTYKVVITVIAKINTVQLPKFHF